jgi:polygalacturonase
MPIRCSEHVNVNNIKVFGHRGNSDGIDICNSRHVTVTGCFLRTWDDLVVVKTPIKGGGESSDITVKGCVLWNELAHALSLGAELRENVEDVHFSDCDVIHDKGREWLLRVYHTDGADIHNITFDNIRIEESKRLISLWIGKAIWSKDDDYGHIENITFQNIQAVGPNPRIDLKGFDSGHEVHDVQFRNVIINGKPLVSSSVNQNQFVQGVTVSP